MPNPMEINARQGDESQSANRANKNNWLWILVAVVVILAGVFALSRANTGPSANEGRVAADTAHVQGGTAPGVGSTYANQPGGREDGTPNPAAAPK